ncbi:MAG: UvrD-helicase domain-containing protein, partial [Pirellulaceae bacterium]|nr:UvrD-helicase domain-containing protein [Pirellulaceae bacterium]
VEAGVDLAFQEMEPEQDRCLREASWSEYVAAVFEQEGSVLNELHECGLEIGQLRATFLKFVDYPDVDQWPAPKVAMGDLEPAKQELHDYVKHMRRLVPTFPDDRGTDRLMDTYEHVIRLVRNRDLNRTAELMQVLERFGRNPMATQKYWPQGTKQGKAELVRWTKFVAKTVDPVLRRWRARRYAIVMHVLTEAAKVYDRVREDSGQLSYQDLMIRASRLLRDYPKVRHYFRGRFTHLLVDEFQDTDPVQAEVMMFLTATDTSERNWLRCQPVPGSLFVVGDPKQSIYRFRRADIVTYNHVKKIISDAGGAVVPLSTNFRSLGDIVSWTNIVFDRTFPAVANDTCPASAPMQVGCLGSTEGTLAGVRVLEVPDAHCGKKESVIEYEADFIARFIRHALNAKVTVPRSRADFDRGVRAEAQPGDFMIVTRNKKHLAVYARKLQELDIAHQVTGGSAWRQIAELGLLAECLCALCEPENPVALVAVLRGELFGISDADLYTYRRAGGTFSYRGAVPANLQENVAHQFLGAFGRLRQYEKWIRKLPLISAVERIAGDLGLPMRALSEAGGDVHAATFAKAFQVLRSAHGQLHCLSDLVSYLAELIEQDAEFDGVPARPHERPVVRIMNLHKVKGLEAPVVFLADPTGRWEPPVTMCVDRSADLVNGYLAVHSESRGAHPPLLACPLDWQEQEQREKQFAAGESKRLCYVAATRAGAELIVTRKVLNNSRNHWQFFAPHLDGHALLADPGPQVPPKRVPVEVSPVDMEAAEAQAAESWGSITQVTYETEAVKKISIATSGPHGSASNGEHGTEWGTVIHLLLEAATRQPQAELRSIAYAALKDHSLGCDLADEALETVDSVMNSQIFRRSQASEKVLLEVPFVICRELQRSIQPVPTLLRGVIDLAFLEPTGWVIVDYKTDVVTRRNLSDLVSRYREQVCHYREVWRAITGTQVIEAGLYFTRVHEYVHV